MGAAEPRLVAEAEVLARVARLERTFRTAACRGGAQVTSATTVVRLQHLDLDVAARTAATSCPGIATRLVIEDVCIANALSLKLDHLVLGRLIVVVNACTYAKRQKRK